MSHEFSIVHEENGHQPSVDDQATVAQLLYDEGITSKDEALKQDEIEELLEDRGIELEYKLRTCLDNLNDIPVIVGRLPPGSKYVPISERRDDIIFGEVEETVRRDRAALVEHIQDDEPDDEDALPLTADGRGITVREVIAADAGIEIVDADEVAKRGTYGKVVFRHKAYRYHLI
jgi:hypothetical protein